MSNCTEKTEEVQFEKALKMISVLAFDALLTCGVRNLDGLLHLTAEEMKNALVSEQVCKEILKIQNLIEKRQTSDTTKQLHIHEMEVVNGQSTPASVEKHNGTPIPLKLIERLSTRARNLLSREQISIIEDLLDLSETDIFKFPGIVRKTARDIKQLQAKIRFNQNSPQTVATHNNSLVSRNSFSSLQLMLRVVSCESEHWPCDPDEWSILSSNLQNLFGLPFPRFEDIEVRKIATIEELGISDSEMIKLFKCGLLYDDTVDFLFNLSLDYIIKIGLSPDTFSKIVEEALATSGNSIFSKCQIAIEDVSNVTIFNDIDISSIDHLYANYDFYDCIYELFSNNNIKWSDIRYITERHIIEKFGFNYQSIRAISSVWNSKLFACKVIDDLKIGLTIDAYKSFQSLIEAFVHRIIKKPIHFKVVMGRLGFLEDRRWTLEELGQQLQLTRERVRQIEKKYMPTLEKPKTIGLLNRLWVSVKNELVSMGGVSCTYEIAKYLKTVFNWPQRPSEGSLASLIT